MIVRGGVAATGDGGRERTCSTQAGTSSLRVTPEALEDSCPDFEFVMGMMMPHPRLSEISAQETIEKTRVAGVMLITKSDEGQWLLLRHVREILDSGGHCGV